jgi:hypothetical protein
MSTKPFTTVGQASFDFPAIDCKVALNAVSRRGIGVLFFGELVDFSVRSSLL